MNLDLTGKKALITAASKGIGFGAAMALAREGCQVIVSSSNPENLSVAVSKIQAETDAMVSSFVMDVSSLQSVAEVLPRILSEHSVDIVLLNGPGPKPMQAQDATDEDLLGALTTNLVSQVAICRAVLPGMIQRRFGRIIALTSTTAREPDPGMVLSNTARAGMIAYAKTLSREVAVHGITVNSILTGGVMTERTRFLLQHAADEQGKDFDAVLEETVQIFPDRHIPSPDEFAATLVYLASPVSRGVNGVSLPIDGGLMRAL